MMQMRALIREHRRWAIALIVLAFCIKALIPAGTMVSHSPDRVLTISLCSESTGTLKTIDIVIPAKDDGTKHSDDAGASHCAFAGLGQVAISGADPILLALALAFILVLGFAPAPRLHFRSPSFLLPPLRGPPAVA